MTLTHYTLLTLLLSLALPAWAKTASPISAVLQADQERLQAMMAGDAAALGKVLSDTLLFVHSDGRIESKADYVKNMLAGDTEYVNVRTEEVRTMEPSPGVVILIGGQKMRKRLGTTWSEISLRFMSVWRFEETGWRMVAWQSMRPSGSSVIPSK
ncbi:MAG TPA: nuclear transport factor 2 family protein [Opitutaceae bacterium]|nr:nuclear transport factor 2 family protein [Opitutaceae bacterium]